jgi:hypothetical protein
MRITHELGQWIGLTDDNGIERLRYDYASAPKPFIHLLRLPDGTIITAIHVDDSRLTFKGKIIERYRTAWAKEFNEELEPLGDTDFAGLRYLFEGEGEARHCKITCTGIIKRLGELLAEHEFPLSYSTETP